jgi:hypothetical protein
MQIYFILLRHTHTHTHTYKKIKWNRTPEHSKLKSYISSYYIYIYTHTHTHTYIYIYNLPHVRVVFKMTFKSQAGLTSGAHVTKYCLKSISGNCRHYATDETPVVWLVLVLVPPVLSLRLRLQWLTLVTRYNLICCLTDVWSTAQRKLLFLSIKYSFIHRNVIGKTYIRTK